MFHVRRETDADTHNAIERLPLPTQPDLRYGIRSIGATPNQGTLVRLVIMAEHRRMNATPNPDSAPGHDTNRRVLQASMASAARNLMYASR